MESFLDYVLMVLPALRIDCFLANTRPQPGVERAIPECGADRVPVFELRTPKHGIEATARLEDGEFVVQAGSKARKAWEGKGSEDTSYGKLFVELVKTGVLAENGPLNEFSDNYAFKSPSAAAAVVNGRPANGTKEWKVVGSGQTYKDWEAEKLSHEEAHDG